MFLNFSLNHESCVIKPKITRTHKCAHFGGKFESEHVIGHAKDYVGDLKTALQSDLPDDPVLRTDRTHNVRESVA